MKKSIIAVVATTLLLAVAQIAHAQANAVFDISGTPRGHEKLGTMTSATGFSSTYTAHSTYGYPFAALISVETAAVRCTFHGEDPVVSGASQKGHLLNAGDSYEIRGVTAVRQTKCINATAGNNAVIMVTFSY